MYRICARHEEEKVRRGFGAHRFEANIHRNLWLSRLAEEQVAVSSRHIRYNVGLDLYLREFRERVAGYSGQI